LRPHLQLEAVRPVIHHARDGAVSDDQALVRIPIWCPSSSACAATPRRCCCVRTCNPEVVRPVVHRTRDGAVHNDQGLVEGYPCGVPVDRTRRRCLRGGLPRPKPLMTPRRRGHVRTCNPEAVRPVVPKLLKTPATVTHNRFHTCNPEAVRPVICCHPRHFEQHHTSDGTRHVRICNPRRFAPPFGVNHSASSSAHAIAPSAMFEALARDTHAAS